PVPPRREPLASENVPPANSVTAPLAVVMDPEEAFMPPLWKLSVPACTLTRPEFAKGTCMLVTPAASLLYVAPGPFVNPAAPPHGLFTELDAESLKVPLLVKDPPLPVRSSPPV